MKSTLNASVPAASSPRSLFVKARPAPLSLQNRARQVGPETLASPALRVPVSPQTRAYLKEQHQAEMAAWEAATPPTWIVPRGSRPVPHLPQPEADRAESRIYALLTTLCVLLLGYEVWTLYQAGGHWQNFVQFVRQLLA